jgi:thiamine biosynthesis protein ThiS
MKLTLNGELREIATAGTISDLLGSLQLAGKFVLVEWNGHAVRRGDYGATKIAEGDTVEIVRLSAGG